MSFEEKLLRTIESSFICCAHKHFDNTGIIKINDFKNNNVNKIKLFLRKFINFIN